MPVSAVPADHLPQVLRHAIVGMVRRDGPDLSARQLAVFLICYLEEGPHTVRGLAAQLAVSKPAITRSLDRLGALGLARRAEDPAGPAQRGGAAHAHTASRCSPTCAPCWRPAATAVTPPPAGSRSGRSAVSG